MTDFQLFSKTVLSDQFTPVAIYRKMREFFPGEPIFLFESVINKDVGNFSYLVIGAYETLIYQNGSTRYIDSEGEESTVQDNPLCFLKQYYSNIDQDYYKECCRELGVSYADGFIGYIGYDVVQEFEPKLRAVMKNLEDRLNVPDFYMIRPKLVLAYSHRNSQLTFISHLDDMAVRFSELEGQIKKSESYLPLKKAEVSRQGSLEITKEEFFHRVDQCKKMIYEGEVFQILMSSRYRQRAKVDPFSFYRMLRTKNPSPYLFLLDLPGFAITGSSPEVMVRLQDGEILLRPIAGTRKRGKTAKKDREMEQEMIADQKEIAEHIMLVDLGRNDVGRVARKGTVQVSHLMRVERYSHVMHMVSDVVADLDEKYDMFDLFAATFTAGTMTGAPKVRAMELIAEIEGAKRGFYSGAIGYFGFSGDMDSGITIRSSLIKPDEIIFHAGAGIVADSQPELEYKEIENKLRALITSLDELAGIAQ